MSKQLQTLFPLIWSNTSLSLLSECELKFFRVAVQNLRKPSFNIDLSAGASFAKGLQTTRELYYNERYSSEEAIEIGATTVVEKLQSAMLSDNDETYLKSPERMALALKTYFKRFPLEEEELIPSLLEDGTGAIEHKLTCELPILHPELGIPLIFKGKLDMLATDGNGRNYIVDEKTTKAISSNTGSLMAASGQFLGYAWLLKQKGIDVHEAQIRKIAIQVKEIKVEPFTIALTPFAVENWYNSMLVKISKAAHAYSQYLQLPEAERTYFPPDFQSGCTSFFRPCQFMESCVSSSGDKALKDIRPDGTGMSDFQQLVWESEKREEIPLADYRKLLGLEG